MKANTWPVNTDAYLTKDGKLVFPHPRAVGAILLGKQMKVFIKLDGRKGKLVGNMTINR